MSYKISSNISLQIPNVKKLLKQIRYEAFEVLKIAGVIGDEIKKNVFVVGGFVRDLLLGLNSIDIDLVIEGDGIKFAHILNNKLDGKITTHERFGTAVINLKNGISIDVVSARKEIYEYPAVLPKIKFSCIWDDLFRRDFTINSMAIQLNTYDLGKLIDYFGGLDDIKAKKIKILHDSSFVEDPTRIFRAIRFSSRYDFDIEEKTKKLMIYSIKNNMINKLSNERISEEFYHILEDKNFIEALKIMEKNNMFYSIHNKWSLSDEIINKISTINEVRNKFCFDKAYEVKMSEIIFMHMLTQFPINQIDSIIYKLTNSRVTVLKVKIALKNRQRVYTSLKKLEINKIELYNLLTPFSLESIIYYYNECDDTSIKNNLFLYINKLSNITLNITGDNLKNIGIKPGPIYKYIFQKILEAKLEGSIYLIEDEIEMAKKLIMLGGRE